VERDLDEAGRPADGAIDVVMIAARTERGLRLPPVIEAGVRTYRQLRSAVDELEVLSQLDGDIGETVALDPAGGRRA
jgi:hypothetical protein